MHQLVKDISTTTSSLNRLHGVRCRVSWVLWEGKRKYLNGAWQPGPPEYKMWLEYNAIIECHDLTVDFWSRYKNDWTTWKDLQAPLKACSCSHDCQSRPVAKGHNLLVPSRRSICEQATDTPVLQVATHAIYATPHPNFSLSCAIGKSVDKFDECQTFFMRTSMRAKRLIFNIME